MGGGGGQTRVTGGEPGTVPAPTVPVQTNPKQIAPGGNAPRGWGRTPHAAVPHGWTGGGRCRSPVLWTRHVRHVLWTGRGSGQVGLVPMCSTRSAVWFDPGRRATIIRWATGWFQLSAFRCLKKKKAFRPAGDMDHNWPVLLST